MAGYKALRDAFNSILDKRINDFLDELGKRADPGSTPGDLVEVVQRWGSRLTAINKVGNTYGELVTRVKLALVLLGISSMTALFGVSYPGIISYANSSPTSQGTPYTWGDISLFFLGLGILSIFWYVFGYVGVSDKISRFEMGESIEKVFEKEIKEAEKGSVTK